MIHLLLRLNRPSSTLTPQCFFHYHEKQRGAPYTPHPPPQCDNTAGLSGRDGVSAAAEQLLLLGVFTASSRTPISDTGGMLLKTQGPADVCVCARARSCVIGYVCVCVRVRVTANAYLVNSPNLTALSFCPQGLWEAGIPVPR